MAIDNVMTKLPEMCFVFIPEALPGSYIRAVRRGEQGCYGTTYNDLDPGRAKALVEHMNGKLGVTPLQAECMLAGSMFGWDAPGADPDLLQAAIQQKQKAPPGVYCGRILGVEDGLVIQKIGRGEDDFVRHPIDRLDRIPDTGELVDITVSMDGRARVSSAERSLER